MAMHNYRVTLTTIGPVHIGAGNTYSKKDYFTDGKHVAVLDVKKFISKLSPGQVGEYCTFLKTGEEGLSDFLKKHKLENVAQTSMLYKNEMRLPRAGFEVHECLKDSENKPYIPGSSLKGMLRTAILETLILQHRDDYAELLNRQDMRSRDKRRQTHAAEGVERHAFRKGSQSPDATSDIMRYISVSDSEPVDAGNLVFVQKYDKFAKSDRAEHKNRGHARGPLGNVAEGNRLNIYRESIKPGVDIVFILGIDDRIDEHLGGISLSDGGLEKVLQGSAKLYESCFACKFDLGDGDEEGQGEQARDGRCRYVTSGGLRCRNHAVDGTGYCNMHQGKAGGGGSSSSSTCYLGGGVGFANKTVGDALFDDANDFVREVAHILYVQFPSKFDRSKQYLAFDVENAGFVPRQLSFKNRRQHKDDHRHWKDIELGVSPHTFKLGLIGKKEYQMGKCAIRIERL